MTCNRSSWRSTTEWPMPSAGRIKEGKYDADDGRLPAETDMKELFGVSLPTLRQGLAVLRAEGLISSQQGKGTFVRRDRPLQRRSRHRYGRARGDEKLLTADMRHEITFAGRGPAPQHLAEAMDVAGSRTPDGGCDPAPESIRQEDGPP